MPTRLPKSEREKLVKRIAREVKRLIVDHGPTEPSLESIEYVVSKEIKRHEDGQD